MAMVEENGTISRSRNYSGPVFLSYGFRPFFLLGSLYAAVAMAVWLPLFYGEISLHSAFAPRDWHVHEMLYGFVPAVIAGFLFTAIPNWTGRLPVRGVPLGVLVALWLCGRMAVSVSADLGWLPAMIIDVSFLALFAIAIGREIFAGRNWRNLRVVVLVALLCVGNVAFHLEAHVNGVADFGIRGGVAVIVLLISVIGGRVIPSFTHNWLARMNPGRLPVSFGRFDIAVIAMTAAALALWTAQQDGLPCAILLGIAGVLQSIRLCRWAGDRTLRERLVLILHVGYAFVPTGFLLASASAFQIVPQSAAIHAWMSGAAGTMILAIMTRASLGHTGRALSASPPTQFIYAAVVIAAVTRIAASLYSPWSEPLLHVAATAWIAAFLGFSICYGPALARARKGSTA